MIEITGREVEIVVGRRVWKGERNGWWIKMCTCLEHGKPIRIRVIDMSNSCGRLVFVVCCNTPIPGDKLDFRQTPWNWGLHFPTSSIGSSLWVWGRVKVVRWRFQMVVPSFRGKSVTAASKSIVEYKVFIIKFRFNFQFSVPCEKGTRSGFPPLTN